MRRFRFALHLLSVRSGRRLVVCFVVLVDIAAVVLTINQSIKQSDCCVQVAERRRGHSRRRFGSRAPSSKGLHQSDSEID